MTNATAHPPANTRGSGMTMRVYVIDRHGTITHDRGTVTVAFGTQHPPLPLVDSYPLCQCPLHRAEQVVSR